MIRYGLEKPYMHHRCRKINMSHPLAPNTTMRNLNSAPVTNYSLKLGAFILSAGAFPVTLRPENPLTEQTVLFRTISTVVNRLRLANLTKRPATNIIRTGQRNLY